MSAGREERLEERLGLGPWLPLALESVLLLLLPLLLQ